MGHEWHVEVVELGITNADVDAMWLQQGKEGAHEARRGCTINHAAKWPVYLGKVVLHLVPTFLGYPAAFFVGLEDNRLRPSVAKELGHEKTHWSSADNEVLASATVGLIQCGPHRVVSGGPRVHQRRRHLQGNLFGDGNQLRNHERHALGKTPRLDEYTRDRRAVHAQALVTRPTCVAVVAPDEQGRDDPRPDERFVDFRPNRTNRPNRFMTQRERHFGPVAGTLHDVEVRTAYARSLDRDNDGKWP